MRARKPKHDNQHCLRSPFFSYLSHVFWKLSWSYGSWIYHHLSNQSVPVTTDVGSAWRGVLDTTLCNKVCQWLATGRWFPPNTPVSSTNTTCLHDIAEILLKVALNTINQTNQPESTNSQGQTYFHINWPYIKHLELKKNKITL